MNTHSYPGRIPESLRPGSGYGPPPGTDPEETRAAPGIHPAYTRVRTDYVSDPAWTPHTLLRALAGVHVELTVMQVSQILDCNASTVRRMTARGHLRCHRTTPKGHRRYILGDVLRYILGDVRRRPERDPSDD